MKLKLFILIEQTTIIKKKELNDHQKEEKDDGDQINKYEMFILSLKYYIKFYKI